MTTIRMMMTGILFFRPTFFIRRYSRFLYRTILHPLTTTQLFLRKNIYKHVISIARSTTELGNIYPNHCPQDNKQYKKISYFNHPLPHHSQKYPLNSGLQNSGIRNNIPSPSLKFFFPLQKRIHYKFKQSLLVFNGYFSTFVRSQFQIYSLS